MSSFIARVKNIANIDNLNIVSFDFHNINLTMMSLELNRNIQIDTKVRIYAKPTNIAIAKDFEGMISYSNQIQTTIINIENGKLLTSLNLEFTKDIVLESIITFNSSKRMNLEVGDKVIAFIKASDISIMEIL